MTLKTITLLGSLCILTAVVSDPSLRAQQSSSVQPKTPTFNAQKAITHLNAGENSPYDLAELGRTNSREAIPALEKQFFSTQDSLDKAHIAQVLVELKADKATYWNYLETVVNAVLDNPSPNPLGMDSDGNETKEISPSFVAWVDANRLTPSLALQNATLLYPAYMTFLGQTGDRRAISLLRRALSSPNYLIAASASQALVDMKDEDSATAITEAVDKAPKAAAQLIATPLVALDNPVAQATFTRVVPQQRASVLRVQAQREKAKQQQ